MAPAGPEGLTSSVQLKFTPPSPHHRWIVPHPRRGGERHHLAAFRSPAVATAGWTAKEWPLPLSGFFVSVFGSTALNPLKTPLLTGCLTELSCVSPPHSHRPPRGATRPGEARRCPQTLADAPDTETLGHTLTPTRARGGSRPLFTGPAPSLRSRARAWAGLLSRSTCGPPARGRYCIERFRELIRGVTLTAASAGIYTIHWLERSGTR